MPSISYFFFHMSASAKALASCLVRFSFPLTSSSRFCLSPSASCSVLRNLARRADLSFASSSATRVASSKAACKLAFFFSLRLAVVSSSCRRCISSAFSTAVLRFACSMSPKVKLHSSTLLLALFRFSTSPRRFFSAEAFDLFTSSVAALTSTISLKI